MMNKKLISIGLVLVMLMSIFSFSTMSASAASSKTPERPSVSVQVCRTWNASDSWWDIRKYADKDATITWDKVPSVAGYQLEIRFDSCIQYKTQKLNSYVLKIGNTPYPIPMTLMKVRVRSYSMVHNTKRVYSDWSSTKTFLI